LALSARAPLSSLCLAAALIALAAYALLYAGVYDLRFLALVCIYAIMVLGFQFIFGHVGAVSLAQSTFFGLGGYVTAIVGVEYGLDSAILLPLSILAAVTLASAIAVPVLKLEDHYFSLATLGVGLVIQLVAVNWEALTGGLNGFSGIPPFRLLGFPIEGRLNVFMLVWACLIGATLLSTRILNSLYGCSFNLVRESPHAAASLGIDVGRMRLAAFLLSAGYGGLAGALMAQVLRVVSPENLDLSLMATCLIMTVVGGSTRPLGAIVGALLIVFLRERFRIAQSYSLIAYTSATLVVLVLAPYGIVGSAERLWMRYTRRPAPEGANAATEKVDLDGLIEQWARRPLSGAQALLSVRDIVKQFGGVRALDGVDLDVREGEIVGLIGPNGSGKTTLINLISGLYVADAGTIFFAGQPVADWPAHAISRLGMARTFQHIDLVDDLGVIDNIAIGAFRSAGATLRATLARLGPDPRLKKARARAAALAALVGVSEVAGSRCGELPYGTRRRVEVARALAADPRLLLLDEPAAGLNEIEQADLAQRIRRIADAGVTVLVIEHNLLFLGALASRLICLDRGRIIAAGSPEEVRRDPRVIEAYLGETA
jgi:branched-chain amino acid transport system ATP-binding protein/branched-chain amino acid transport system permease protein